MNKRPRASLLLTPAFAGRGLSAQEKNQLFLAFIPIPSTARNLVVVVGFCLCPRAIKWRHLLRNGHPERSEGSRSTGFSPSVILDVCNRGSRAVVLGLCFLCHPGPDRGSRVIAFSSCRRGISCRFLPRPWWQQSSPTPSRPFAPRRWHMLQKPTFPQPPRQL